MPSPGNSAKCKLVCDLKGHMVQLKDEISTINLQKTRDKTTLNEEGKWPVGRHYKEAYSKVISNKQKYLKTE